MLKEEDIIGFIGSATNKSQGKLTWYFLMIILG